MAQIINQIQRRIVSLQIALDAAGPTRVHANIRFSHPVQQFDLPAIMPGLSLAQKEKMCRSPLSDPKNRWTFRVPVRSWFLL
jgi:hypothetical protein